ncbi:helix-turn-helix domain-containing protein [Anaerovibrio sp.]|uniref:helix-turn-helix domain-containing protein n=1 Tax=Anaerovibrio sp. TaxID=1872532 RepID=UPI003F13B1DE
MKKLAYIKDISTGIETISYEHVNIAYPLHTHIGHIVFGIVTDGIVGVQIDRQECLCHSGEIFSIAPDVPHAIYPASDFYSMISICVPQRDSIEKELNIIKRDIIGNPELEISIADMAEKVHISPYHMIRKFAGENGLTPHKFQMQCRIRKAQELLEQGVKVIDVAAAVGFCDQSHLCRVFKKQVGISPEEYSKSAILYKPEGK